MSFFEKFGAEGVLVWPNVDGFRVARAYWLSNKSTASESGDIKASTRWVLDLFHWNFS